VKHNNYKSNIRFAICPQAIIEILPWKITGTGCPVLANVFFGFTDKPTNRIVPLEHDEW
jgi:hypothetical protein